jgi:hypothetical protein
MTGLRSILHVVHAFALCVWLAALMMSAAVPAIAFPLMRTLNPRLPEYAAYDESHAYIAAGQLASRTFLVADIAAFGAAMLALVSFAGSTMLFGRSMPGGGGVLAGRGLCLAAGLSGLGFNLLVLAPRMNTTLNDYWAAARAGQNQAAAALRDAFQQDHPTATGLLTATALAVVGALLLALLPGRPHDGPVRTAAARAGGERLEEPALLRGGGGGA